MKRIYYISCCMCRHFIATMKNDEYFCFCKKHEMKLKGRYSRPCTLYERNCK